MPEELPPESDPTTPNDTSRDSPAVAQGSGLNNEEAALKDASASTGQLDEQLGTLPPQSAQTAQSVSMKSGGGKKKALFALLIMVLIAGGVFAAMTLLKKDNTTSGTGNTNTEKSADSDTSQAQEPNTIPYAFKATNQDPVSLYWRPAGGGDRKDAMLLSKNEVVLSSDARRSSVAVLTSAGIYVSKDSGAQYKKVLEISAGQHVTSLKLSADATRLAYDFTPTADAKAVIKSVDLDGKDSKDLFTADQSAVYVYGWNQTANQIVYGEHTCVDCDGGATTVLSRDIKANTKTTLIEANDLKASAYGPLSPKVSSDLSQVLYVVGTATGEASLIGDDYAAPYELKQLNIKDKTAKTVATIGKKGEKNANGTTRYRQISYGFFHDSSANIYYSDDVNVFSIKNGGEATIIFTAEKPITTVSFVNENVVIAGAGADTSDYALTSYSLSSKKPTAIFQGDNNTQILGVTTK